jgi:hypothetical protein
MKHRERIFQMERSKKLPGCGARERWLALKVAIEHFHRQSVLQKA